jgi:hypothetical protein
MNTLDFLKRVLPSEGLYCSFTVVGKYPKQVHHQTIEELAAEVLTDSQKGHNTYFAISAFNSDESREQANVRVIKTFALDIDCGEGKPYPSWKEGLLVLSDYIRELNLPGPMIVRSGNGLHVYWTLTTEMTPQEWRPIATAFKASAVAKFKELAEKRGIISPTPSKPYIDPAVPADHARVLRPVGTVNTKGGNTVALIFDAPPVDPQHFASFFPVTYGSPSEPPPRHASGSTLLDNLAVKQDYPPSNADAVLSKCQQIKWMYENRHDKTKIDEPIWYRMLGVAAFCHDSHAVAIKWSEGHPEFDPQATIDKMEQWKQKCTGPTSCEKIEEVRPDGCKGCKFKGKVSYPTQLGIQYQEVQIAPDALDTAAYEVELPKPFKRTNKGIKVSIDDADIDVCPFDIYPVGYGRDESLGYEVVRYHWNRQHIGWQPLNLRQAFLTDGSREFAGAIADQGIVLFNKKQTEYFQYMLRTYMDKLRQQRAMTNLYSTMGWKHDYTEFVMGDTILRCNKDGTITEEQVLLSSTSQRLGHDLYGTSGSLAEWREFTRIMPKVNLLGQMFAIGVSLSSPLYAFTGLKSTTVSLYGPTGCGKTLAQLWGQSVWGVPEKLHFAAKYTQNAVFARFGLYCNMPLTIDETTMMDVKDVGDFLYWISQGRDKARLNRNAEERESKEWQAPAILSNNTSMGSKLVASGMETTAQMVRLLEVSLQVHPIFKSGSTAGRDIYNFISSNYGHAGREFVKYLLQLGPEGMKAIVDDAFKTFPKRYHHHFTGEERFWEQAIVLADLAVRLAYENNIVAFPPEVMTNWILNQIGALRKTVIDYQNDGFDMLTEYLNEHANMALTVWHTGDTKPAVDMQRLPRGEVRARFDCHRKDHSSQFDHGTVMVDRTHFRKWLAMKGVDYRGFIREMTSAQIVVTPKSNKASLGKDSPIKLPQSYVIALNLSHPRLKGILEDEDMAIDNTLLGQLKVVQ